MFFAMAESRRHPVAVKGLPAQTAGRWHAACEMVWENFRTAVLATDFLFALITALLIAGILAPVLGRRRITRHGGWTFFMLLFLLLLGFIWAGGVWLLPFGPLLWGAYLLPFLAVGFLLALLIAALFPPDSSREPSQPATLEQVRESETTATALGVFFWLALFFLTVAIVTRYW
jgi:hypothetical protein